MRRPEEAEEVERWRAGRLARLLSPDGWLSLVALEWLREGENTLGSDPSNDVVLPKGPARAGAIEVRGSRVRLVANIGAGLSVDGEPAGLLDLADDADGDPTVVEVGTLRFHVIRREGRPAVRVKDSDSPARRSFGTIESYPIDVRWRVEARFEPAPGRTVLAPDVLGTGQTYSAPGTLAFDIDGAPSRLEAFQESDEDDLFIVFGDATNGDTTFEGGRYLYSAPPDDRGVVVVDFNKSYNPPCVFTPFATCVLPLPENRLSLRIEAGEKRYQGGGAH